MTATIRRWMTPLLPGSPGPAEDVVDGWPGWWAAVGWLAAVFAAGLATGAAEWLGAEPRSNVALLAGQIGLWAVFVGTAAKASRSFGSGNLRPDFGMSTRIADAVRALALGVGLQLVIVPAVYLPFALLKVDLDVSGPAESLVQDASRLEFAVIALGVAAAAPVAEELLFRGVLLRGLSRRIGSRWGVFASALLFAGTHFQLVQFPGLLIVGLALAWLATRSRGIGAAIWAHAGFNATTVLALW